MAERRTAYLDGSLELEQDGLVDEDLARLGAEVLDLVLLELHGLAGAVASDWEGSAGGGGGRADSSASSAAGKRGSSPSSSLSMTESRSISVVASAMSSAISQRQGSREE